MSQTGARRTAACTGLKFVSMDEKAIQVGAGATRKPHFPHQYEYPGLMDSGGALTLEGAYFFSSICVGTMTRNVATREQVKAGWIKGQRRVGVPGAAMHERESS
ncbi:MAG: hypothetical protein ACN6OP_02450 [Pseudomonadales bacterium]